MTALMFSGCKKEEPVETVPTTEATVATTAETTEATTETSFVTYSAEEYKSVTEDSRQYKRKSRCRYPYKSYGAVYTYGKT